MSGSIPLKTKLHLGKPEDLDKVLPMVAAFHANMGVEQDEDMRRAAIAPLLDGSPLA